MKTTPAILTTAIISAASLFLTTTSGQAEVRSWTGTYAPGSGRTPWSNAGNWSNGAPVAGDTLFFQGATRRTDNTNDYAAGTSFGGLTFGPTTANFTITGNDLTLAGFLTNQSVNNITVNLNLTLGSANSGFDVQSTGLVTIPLGYTLSSSYGLIKSGAGTLAINSASNISGDIIINEGQITVAVSNALGTGGALTINSGTLAVHVGSSTTHNFTSLSGSTSAVITNTHTTLNRPTTFVINGSTDSAYAGTIIDGSINTVQIRKEGTSTLTLTGLLSSAATSSVSGGVLQIGNGGTSGRLEANIVNTATVAFNRSDVVTYAHNMSSTGKLQQLGSGTLILTGTNTYSGGTDLVNGTIQLGSFNALTTSGTGANGAINFNGGILQHTAENTRDYSAKFSSIAAGKQARIDTNGQAVTYNTALNGAGGLEKRGAGSLTLTGVNTFTGATNVSAGTLLINGSLTSSSGVDIASGAVLGGSGIVSNIGGAGTVGNRASSILTASSVDGSTGLDFAFKFTAATPDYSNAAASGNDILRLTGANPFTTALNSSNTITLDFSSLSLEMGESVLGGFYTNTDTLSGFEDARYSFIGLGDGYGIHVSMIQHLANFTGGSENGYISQFTVVAIPEPTSVAMALLGGGFLASRVLRRKKVS